MLTPNLKFPVPTTNNTPIIMGDREKNKKDPILSSQYNAHKKITQTLFVLYATHLTLMNTGSGN